VIPANSGIIRAFIIGACTCGAASAARAHDIHTTLASVTTDASGTTITVRSFADDFSASVARSFGRPAPADSSVTERDAFAYAVANLGIVTARGGTVAPVSCGLRRERDLYFICVRIPPAPATGALRIRNTMLTELHADQVNIVQVVQGNRRKTLLFTKGSAAQTLTP
jgi:hypothetical protein